MSIASRLIQISVLLIFSPSTRVPNGRVLPVYGFEGGGKTLKDAGAVFADNLSPQKARILLMLALQDAVSPSKIKQSFDR